MVRQEFSSLNGNLPKVSRDGFAVLSIALALASELCNCALKFARKRADDIIHPIV